MKSTAAARRMAATLSMAVVLVAVTPTAGAAAAASFSGRVFAADGLTPRTDVVVSLVDRPGERTFRSQPTRDDGTFRIADAPAGAYDLMVETQEGAFVSEQPVELQTGANPPLALALRLGGANYQGSGDVMETGFGSGKLPRWGKWVIVGAVSVGALFLLDEVSSDETPSSPF